MFFSIYLSLFFQTTNVTPNMTNEQHDYADYKSNNPVKI